MPVGKFVVKATGWSVVTTMCLVLLCVSTAQHSSRLTFTTFMPGRGTSLLLSGDVR